MARNYGPTLQCMAHHRGQLLAKGKLDHPVQEPIQYWIPFGGWVCYLGKQCLTKQFAIMICNHVNGQITVDYCKNGTSSWTICGMWWIDMSWKELSKNLMLPSVGGL